MTLVEICVEDVDGARIAEEQGADRIELCSDLLEGGITPSIGLVSTTLAALDRIPVHVLIRPRGGDFVYDRDEVAVMLSDIAALTALSGGVGFVLSGLTPSGEIDRGVVARLVAACGGAPVTFSRAFDAVRDQFAALDVLADLGVHRVLTGGGPGTAAEGADVLARLVRHGAGRISVLAGGSVRSGNVADVVARTGVREVRPRAPVEVGGRMRTSADEVRAVVAALRPAESR